MQVALLYVDYVKYVKVQHSDADPDDLVPDLQVRLFKNAWILDNFCCCSTVQNLLVKQYKNCYNICNNNSYQLKFVISDGQSPFR
jgi:hypothetical protein